MTVDTFLITIFGSFAVMSLFAMTMWRKYRAPLYVLYAYSNLMTALLLVAMAVYLYEAVGELVWIMGVVAIINLVLAVLCLIFKRPLFLPTNASHFLSIPKETPLYVVGTSIQTPQDFQDELGTALYSGKHAMMFDKEKLPVAFFDLKTGFAGEMLQKLENYKLKAVIVGDISTVESESFQAFVRESNRGQRLFFVESEEAARKILI